MKPALALVISLGLNVALALTAARVLHKPAAEASRAAAAGATLASVTEVRLVTNLPPQSTFVTNRFHWRQLESTNWDEFVANLRAIGCPERTIRDIVLAEIAENYASHDRRAPRVPFWSNGPRRMAAQRQHEAEQFRLKTELAAIVRRLFGIEWSPEIKRDPFDDELMVCRVMLGDVSEEQFQRACSLILAAPQARKDLEWRCPGLFLAEDYAELMRRRDDLERELRAVLSPAQFEEFSARAGIMNWIFHGAGLEQLKPTPAELRQISLASTQVRPLGWKFLELDDSLSDEEKAKDEAAMGQRVRKILGAARYAECELLQDHRYQSVYSFVQETQLPLDTAHKLYEIQKLTASEVQGLRQDKTLDASVRTQRLEAVTASVSREISALLGPKRFGEFLRQSGQWVTNANRL